MTNFKSILTLLAVVLLFATSAKSIDIWEKDGALFKINGDIHFGTFLTGIDSTQTPAQDPVSVKAKGEIDFDFRGKLNKNLSYGAEVEIRPDSDGVDVDEYYAFIKDKRYGSVYLGTTKSPASKRHVRAPEFYAKDLNAIEGPDFVPLKSIETAKNETDIDYDEDVHKIIYYTPRVWGIELGASYAPDIGKDGKGDDENAYNNIGAAPDRRRPATHKDALSFSINAEYDLGAMDVATSFGYLTAKGVVASNDDGDDISSLTLNAWSLGGAVGVKMGKAGKLNIGAGFLKSKGAANNAERESVFIGGLSHELNSAFTYGIHYRYAVREGKGKDEEIEFGGHYAFNKYLKLSSGIELLKSQSIEGEESGRGIAVHTVLSLNF